MIARISCSDDVVAVISCDGIVTLIGCNDGTVTVMIIGMCNDCYCDVLIACMITVNVIGYCHDINLM